MKKIIIWLAALALLAGAALAEGNIASKADLNRSGIRIGISQGSAAEAAVKAELPEAAIDYYNDNLLGFTAVAQGKLDAYVYDLVQMQLTIDGGLTGVHLLPETMDSTVQIAVGYSDVSAIPELGDRLNRFIAEVKADGTMDDMYRRWVLEGNLAMPDIPLPESPQLHLTVGTTGNVPPYSYYGDGGLTGFDIELAHRFAAWLGADLSFQVIDFNGAVAAVQTGKVDVIMSNLQYLPERAEAMPFSDILYEEKLGIMVRGDGDAALPGSAKAGAEQSEKSGAAAFQAYAGKRIGVVTGAIQGPAVEKEIPSAVLSYFNTVPDLLTAARSNKIDAFATTDLIMRYLMLENDDLTYLDVPLTEPMITGAIFPRTEAGAALRSEFNEYLAEARDAGILDEIEETWLGRDEAKKTVPELSDLSGENGTLVLATDASVAPNSYVKDNKYVGMDIDNALRFCKARGYALKIVDMNFGALVDATVTGKCDFAVGSIAYTKERAASVDFSDPVFQSQSVIAYLSDGSDQPIEGGFLRDILNSFNKTFMREERWRLFAQGVLTTLLITLLAILFGTALGFGMFMLCRNGNPAANLVVRFCLWLVRGMPMVVLLMIIYYIIFGSVAIGGVTVAVISFTLTFGAAVFGLLKMGVGAVDGWQYEAASALGYSNRRTFFKIILPQALPHVLPAYKGEIVGLIKATAIVGYIAVQDLTKMGDIVRSRTYEAFFPLIAVTVIYFALEGLIGLLVSRISVNLNPKRRKPAEILNGIKGR